MIPTRLLCCPRRIRTTTNRTKTCCATITPLDNCGCKGTIFFALLQNFRILFCQAILFCRFPSAPNVTFRLLYDTIRSSLRSAPTGYAFKTKRRKKLSSLNAQQKKRVCQYKTLAHSHCVLSQPTQAARKVTSNQPKYHEYYGIVHINQGS